MTTSTPSSWNIPGGPFLSSVTNRYGTGVRRADKVFVLSRAVTAASAVLVALAAVVLFVSGQVNTAVDDVLEVAAAAVAAVSCGLAAAGSRGRLRLGWAALCGGCASWAAGEVIWSVYDLALHRQPFPSAADLGFLLFPVGASVALLVFPARATGADRRRMILDGLTTAVAVGLVSLTTVLHAVIQSHTDGMLATAVSVAYPLTDIVLVVLCVQVLSRAAGRRTPLVLIGAGIALMAVADSGFAYTTANDSYQAGGLVDLGWYLGFLLFALAPFAKGALDERPVNDELSAAGGWLPYIPLALASGVEITLYGMGHRPGIVEASLCGMLMALILVRQALTVRDNKQLAASLLHRERELRHLAFHDGLTGLANRALFVDRVRHALALHSRDGRPLSVCFLDLDGFKCVNDTLGHAAGDELLRQAAARFQAVLSRADTLARFGGDEFAVLLEDPIDALNTATRLVAALDAPFTLGLGTASVQVSVGVASVVLGDVTPTLDELLTQTDVAMYAVKRQGKAGVQHWSTELDTDGHVPTVRLPRPRTAPTVRTPAC